MEVSAILSLVLRELPATDERHGFVFVRLDNVPTGLPTGTSMARTPLSLRCTAQRWHAACAKAAQMRASGAQPVLKIDAHVGARNNELIAIIRGIQVVPGKHGAPV
jgi:hypothetical protein